MGRRRTVIQDINRQDLVCLHIAGPQQVWNRMWLIGGKNVKTEGPKIGSGSYSPTNLNGSPHSQLGLMKYCLIVVIHHIFWHPGTYMGEFAFIYAVGTWTLEIRAAGRRKVRKTKHTQGDAFIHQNNFYFYTNLYRYHRTWGLSCMYISFK